MSQLEKASLERSFEELSKETSQNTQEAIGERALCWLALLPEWNATLAAACKFPVEPEPLEEMLELAERAGLCKVRREARTVDGPQVHFWMRPEMRSWLFEQWQLNGGPSVRREIQGIASRIREIYNSGELKVSPGVLRWAELALGELKTSVSAGDALAERVGRSLDKGDISEAGEWIFAAQALAVPLGAELKLAVARARRQLNLHYRRVQDKRYVAEFVKRDEQIREMRRLIKSKDQWAVHFIGQSGVGKTMLMRYLTGRLPDADPYTFSARVDFDYLDPRFPLEAPARLLHELGEGLAANLADPDQEANHRSFQEAVTLAEAAEADPALPDLLATPQFAEVIATFATLVNSLPQPVVLILDTCEELAKLHPAGEDIPSIRAMFKILNRVHNAAPSVRVVLAGRRWLTRRAANKVRLKMPPAVEKMEERTYMRMHPVLGFTQEEAEDYLHEARGLELSDEMTKTILQFTLDAGVPPSMDKEALGPVEQPRYSPSDIALFAGWIEREPDLKPEELAKDNRDDPYVEVRIFEKIESPDVLAAIPAVALLERFDVETIRPALAGDSRAKTRAIDGLIEQEWTHLEDGVGPDEMVISIDSGLLRRLTTYFEASPERRRRREEARQALTPHLAEMFERPTSEVPPDRIDSAVRALPVENTLFLLNKMEERVVAEPAWPWAEAVGGFLLSEEREPRLPPKLAAPIRALYVAALKHLGSSADLGEQWRAVIQEARNHPYPDQAMALSTRGRLGILTAEASNGGYDALQARADLNQGRLMLHRRAVAEAVGPGLLAAIEAILDAHEERGYPIPVDSLRECLAALLERFKDEDPVWAYVLALEGRMRAATGDWGAAREAFERLEDLPPEAVHGTPRFADWVPPASIGHRTLLELLRFRLADGSEGLELVERCERAGLTGAAAADAAQLLSLVLQARLARGGLTTGALEDFARFEVAVGDYEVVAPAHRVAAPLFVSLAEAWLSVGRPARALDLLEQREQAAVSRRTDEGAIAAAALATVRIVRVLRSRERLGLIGGFSSVEDEDLRSEALAAGALIAGLRPPPNLEIEGDHAAWRARNLLDPRLEEGALRAMRWSKLPPSDGPAGLHVALDRLEAAQVEHRCAGGARLYRFRARREVNRLAAAWRSAPSITEPLGDEELRLRLRLCALSGDDSWPEVPGRSRQVGRLALKEGELLALRLPHRAVPLLRFAEQCLDRAGHLHGAFFAGLRAVIAEIHAGELDAAESRRGAIIERYRAVCREEPEAPSVERLLDGEGDSDQRADSWPGWTSRLAAYLRWCEGADLNRDDATALLASEPELTLVPAAGAPGSTLRSWRLTESRQGALFTLVALLFSVTLFGTLLARTAGSSTIVLLVGAVVGTALISLVGSFAAGAVARSVPLGILPIDGFDISITPPPRGRAGDGMVKARVEPWTRRRLVRGNFRLWRPLRSRSRWEALVTPGNEMPVRAPSGPLGLAVKSRARGGFNPVRLAVTSDLARLAWERRLVWHLALEERWSPERAPQVWRIRPPGYFAAHTGQLPIPLTAAVSTQWRPFVQSVAAPGVEWTSGVAPAPARAAIALGFPVRTRAGWRLRLDDEVAGAARTRVQRLLSPDGLVRRAPIAVVVARPSGRLAPEQRIADGLRGFANETFLAGAHAVVVVPALPPERTAEAIELLTGEISKWESVPQAEQLLDLTTRLRCTVFRPAAELEGSAAESTPQERERTRRQRAELALDVCLFAPR